MKEKFTPGPWRRGKAGGCVVSDSNENLTVRGAYESGCIEYYGGYLIGESMTPSNAALISAAPDMYRMLKVISEKDQSWKSLIDPVIKKALNEGGQ
jgi:hypothetical protein